MGLRPDGILTLLPINLFLESGPRTLVFNEIDGLGCKGLEPDRDGQQLGFRSLLEWSARQHDRASHQPSWRITPLNFRLRSACSWHGTLNARRSNGRSLEIGS